MSREAGRVPLLPPSAEAMQLSAYAGLGAGLS